MKYFNFVVSIVFIILYAAGRIPPSEKYNLWLTSFIIPVALGVNAILLILSLAMRKKSSLYYVLALIIGSNYVVSTFGMKYLFKSSDAAEFTFDVLSFNTGANLERPDVAAENENKETTNSLSEWIFDRDADVQCYQEFIDRRRKSGFDLLNRLKTKVIKVISRLILLLTQIATVRFLVRLSLQNIRSYDRVMCSPAKMDSTE